MTKTDISKLQGLGNELEALMDEMAASESDDEDENLRDKVRDVAGSLFELATKYGGI